MKNNNFILKLISYFKKEKTKISKNYLTFLFFVIVATFLWFFNALNKQYIYDISYPVKFINNNKKIILVSKFPKNLTFNVKTTGYNILKNKLSVNTLPIIIDINKNFKKINNKLYFVPNSKKSTLRKKIENSNNILIYSIEPDTIFAEYTTTVTKKIKVLPNINYKIKEQHFLKKISVLPDSIQVTGPKIILDTIKYIKTNKLNFGELNKTIKRNIQLEKINEISYKNKRVNIKIIVEKFTQAKIKVPIKLINTSDSVSAMLIPKDVTITYNVGLSDFKKIKATDFKVISDLSKIKETSKFIRVQLVKYPSFIKNIEYSPQQVKFLIFKND